MCIRDRLWTGLLGLMCMDDGMFGVLCMRDIISAFRMACCMDNSSPDVVQAKSIIYLFRKSCVNVSVEVIVFGFSKLVSDFQTQGSYQQQ